MTPLIEQLRAKGLVCELWQLPGTSKGVLQVTDPTEGPWQGCTTYIGVDWTLEHALLHIDGKRESFRAAENK